MPMSRNSTRPPSVRNQWTVHYDGVLVAVFPTHAALVEWLNEDVEQSVIRLPRASLEIVSPRGETIPNPVGTKDDCYTHLSCLEQDSRRHNVHDS